MKKFPKLRLIAVAAALFLQTALLIFFSYNLFFISDIMSIFLFINDIIIAVHIINSNSSISHKMLWVLAVLAMPFISWSVYPFFNRSKINHLLCQKYTSSALNIKSLCRQDISAENILINSYGNFPVFANTQTYFLNSGESFFSDFLEEISSAKKFIFLEYFIIAEGEMWSKVLEILKRKAFLGIDIRIIFDDMGCIDTLPSDYAKSLSQTGIKAFAFNRFTPAADTASYYRTHRKIAVIDGKTAYTGGLNLADEYINLTHKFGHWNDCALKLKGEAVCSFTAMFLSLWGTKFTEKNPAKFTETYPCKTDGFVQPFCDNPLCRKYVSRSAYISIIQNSKNYVYISTPYLVIDDEIKNILILNAHLGKDIRILTPAVPDKKFVHLATRSNYTPLIAAGIKIYEYTGGFIHSKTIVSDDEYAIVGTANFDYRSLFMNFEDGVFLYKSGAVSQIYDDYMRLLEISTPITADMCRLSPLGKAVSAIVNIFSPLM